MMKKILNILSVFLVTLLLVTSCESDPIIFDGSKGVVGFSSSTLVVVENTTGNIKIYLGGELGLAATDVTVEVDITGIETPAILGTDFTLSTTTVNAVVGESSITVNPIDNDIFTGDKLFKLKIVSNSKNYAVAVQDEITVTIADNEHPLGNWIGTYDVDAQSYGDPVNWDETWVVTTAAVAGDPTKLSMLGIGGGNKAIIGVFDLDEMTITIAGGQDCGNAHGYDFFYNYYGFEDLTLDKDADLTGTIDNDGTIVIDNWAQNGIYDDEDYGVWDVFHTTWTLR